MKLAIRSLCTAALFIAAASVTLAHMGVTKTEPEDGAILDKAPEAVQVWYTQEPDAAVSKVQKAVAAGQPVYGWEVDRATRDVIAAAGYGDYFIHRTGHSLGEEVHGNGVHMDDYETHDDRRLVTGTGFTIEPGIYNEHFGVRTEINMVVGPTSAEVTGPRQTEMVRIATGR